MTAGHSADSARGSTVGTDIADFREDIAVGKAGQGDLERSFALPRDDVADLRAGQVEIRNLLSRIVAKLDDVARWSDTREGRPCARTALTLEEGTPV
ncbi:hypothetical protein IMZ11_06760 [Microtetraspora sp. AC03309]|uniref:hypothetical protein n=1 Tax=Microtetraspora sp. AC03309 TaxID=2779376 RepID=UPI001E4A758D|nr:hypothetical protein [Microtetraspora sp. AC03309]MCC5575342.1 hypothetical protein [Microtetraspora sp. AC03309]